MRTTDSKEAEKRFLKLTGDIEPNRATYDNIYTSKKESIAHKHDSQYTGKTGIIERIGGLGVLCPGFLKEAWNGSSINNHGKKRIAVLC